MNSHDQRGIAAQPTLRHDSQQYRMRIGRYDRIRLRGWRQLDRWLDMNMLEVLGLPARGILLHANQSRKDRREALKRIRAGDRPNRLPGVTFTSSKDEQDISRNHDLGPNSRSRKPLYLGQPADAVRQPGLH